MLQVTDFVGISPNVESVRRRLFYFLLVLLMLYVNISIYVLYFLEVQTIHLARRVCSYCELIPHLAEAGGRHNSDDVERRLKSEARMCSFHLTPHGYFICSRPPSS